jgi:hypothetical protein
VLIEASKEIAQMAGKASAAKELIEFELPTDGSSLVAMSVPKLSLSIGASRMAAQYPDFASVFPDDPVPMTRMSVRPDLVHRFQRKKVKDAHIRITFTGDGRPAVVRNADPKFVGLLISGNLLQPQEEHNRPAWIARGALAASPPAVEETVAPTEPSHAPRRGSDDVAWLTTVPATDPGFRSTLERATEEDLRAALAKLQGKGGANKGRIAAIERKLKRLVQSRNGGGE